MDKIHVSDLGSTPAEELAASLCSWAGSVAASEYRWLRVVAEFDRRKLYERWECRSCAEWLMWQCSLDIRSAHDKVRVARAMETLPELSAGFAAGELSYSKVRALTRVATPADEARWVDIARSVPTTGLERIVAATRRAAQLNGGTEESRQARRGVTSRYEDDGMVTTIVRLTVDEHALLVRGIEAVLEIDPQRSAEQRRADAFVQLLAQFLAGGDQQAPVRTADRYQTIVRVDAATLTATRAHVSAPGEANVDGRAVPGADSAPAPGEANVDGRAVPGDTVRRLCCDGSVVWLVENADGDPVGVSKKTRTVSAAVRRALHARDRICQFPGCANSGWLDAHHLIHWANGGPTTLDNLILLCRRHHRAVHEGHWHINHSDRGLQFTGPNGRALHTLTPTIYDLDLHLAPEAITPNWWGDPIDLGYITAVMSQPAAFA